MKKIEAIIRADRFTAVRVALLKEGFRGLTVTDVKGLGKQKGLTERYRGAELHVDLLPRVKIEIVASAAQAEKVVQTIMQAARTGEVGDGIILIHPLDEVIRIRTGEKGEEAI